MTILRPRLRAVFFLTGLLLTACGDDARDGTRRGCTADHDASGTYRFSAAYLDERLRLLAQSYEVEERAFDAEALGAFVDGIRDAWEDATLTLFPDGTFTLTGVALPAFQPNWQGTWEVHLDERECRLYLRGGGEELHALLGDGWTIPWIEEPQPGVILDVRLDR